MSLHMSLSWKKRVLTLGLALFTAWPPLQMFLSFHYHVNPWKLGAWGMYSIPDATPGLALELLHDGQWSPGSWTQIGGRRLIAQARNFKLRRYQLGRLTRPDAIAESILEARPEADGVAILIIEAGLDRATARLVQRPEQRLEYLRRDGD